MSVFRTCADCNLTKRDPEDSTFFRSPHDGVVVCEDCWQERLAESRPDPQPVHTESPADRIAADLGLTLFTSKGVTEIKRDGETIYTIAEASVLDCLAFASKLLRLKEQGK